MRGGCFYFRLVFLFLKGNTCESDDRSKHYCQSSDKASASASIIRGLGCVGCICCIGCISCICCIGVLSCRKLYKRLDCTVKLIRSCVYLILIVIILSKLCCRKCSLESCPCSIGVILCVESLCRSNCLVKIGRASCRERVCLSV